jgi:hypothetical protein
MAAPYPGLRQGQHSLKNCSSCAPKGFGNLAILAFVSAKAVDPWLCVAGFHRFALVVLKDFECALQVVRPGDHEKKRTWFFQVPPKTLLIISRW